MNENWLGALDHIYTTIFKITKKGVRNSFVKCLYKIYDEYTGLQT